MSKYLSSNLSGRAPIKKGKKEDKQKREKDERKYVVNFRYKSMYKKGLN